MEDGGTGRADDLAGLAVALTGDADRAAVLLGEVEARAAAGTPADVDPRTLLVERYLRLARTDPAPAPAPPSRLPAELLPVWARLTALPPLARAALVLRLRDGLTRQELARLLDRPAVAVGRALDRAEAQVAAADLEVLAVLARLPVPEPALVQRAGRAAGRRRARRRDRVLLAAGLAVVLLVGATVVPEMLGRRPVFLRPYGAWVHGFDLEPGAGWRVVGRQLSPERDGLTVVRDADERQVCNVFVVTSLEALTIPEGRRTRVGGRSATVVGGPDAHPYLWWALGPRSAAVVGCMDTVGTTTLLELAHRVRPREVPVLLPFDLSRLGPGQDVRLIARREHTMVVLGLPAGVVGRAPGSLYLTVPGGERFGEDQQRRSDVKVGGRTATLTRGRDGGIALCWPVQGSSACVSGYVAPERDDPGQDRLLHQVNRTAAALRFASDLTRDRTWFDSRTALPG